MRRPGFSMISLLVLLGILAFGMALVSTFLGRIRGSASRTHGMNNLRVLAIGVHSFHDAHEAFPPMVGKVGDTSGTAHFHILPYLEQEPLHHAGRKNMASVRDQLVPVFVDKLDPSVSAGFLYQGWLATTSYAGNWLVLRDGGNRFADISDGTSNTILFTQRFQLCAGEPTGWSFDRLHPWAPMFAFSSGARFQDVPDKSRCDPHLPQALTSEGILVVLCDGSVHSILSRCSPATWSAATTPDGNEVLNGFDGD